MVSLHVPAHNEPPDMVIDTLRALLQLDYPRYEVILIDDNTDDEDLWRPVEAWCASHGVKFKHLENWPGYKSGALNYALRHLTDPDAEIIGVVDSDYQVDPGFLMRCAPAFEDPWIGFVQAPQDYRDWEHARYYRRLYYSYKYFFAVSQPSRNEHDGAIFAGTMGLIRRVALDELGGWDEWCITEDAELSLRLLRAGWSGLHVDQSGGHGIMPLTFEALKGQRYRWCFGGIQILRMHWRSLLPGRRDQANRLSSGQRWAYLAGAFQWYGDLLSLLFFIFLLAGAANLATGGGELFRKLTVFLVATVPVLVALGLVRAIALLRRGTGASWRDAIGAFFIWQSTSLVVARASVLALFAKKAAFLRTPKTGEDTSWFNALRANWAETTLAVFGLAGIIAGLTKAGELSGPLLAALLLFPTLGLAAAPYNSLAARRAALPAQLRERRRTEYRRERHTLAAGIATGGAVAVAGVAALAIVLMLGGHHVTGPSLVGPARGTPATTAPSTPSPTRAPQQHPDPDPHVRDAQHNPLDVHHADPIPVDVGDHDPVSHPLSLDNHDRPLSPQNRITGVSLAPGPIVQYFGPTNSSSRATASLRATEMVFGFENRHATPSWSKVCPQSHRMSVELLVNRYRGYSYQCSSPPHVSAHPVDTPVPVRMEQPSGEIPRDTAPRSPAATRRARSFWCACARARAAETGTASAWRCSLPRSCRFLDTEHLVHRHHRRHRALCGRGQPGESSQTRCSARRRPSPAREPSIAQVQA